MGKYKLLFHCLKHAKSHCIGSFGIKCVGALLGRREGETVSIVDAIPLFHTQVLAPSLELAFEMVLCSN